MQVSYAKAVLATVALTLGGCASTPETLQGEFADLAPADAGESDIGATVRWGGQLLAVEPEPERTCFEVLSRPLNKAARPQNETPGTGRRFLACSDGFIDPAAYPADRDVTLVGELTGFETRAIGGYDYDYPVLALDTVHIWAKRPELDAGAYPHGWWYGPYPRTYFHSRRHFHR